MSGKRDTLKQIAGLSAVAAALPKAWTKPIIDGVVLPAHAQTSPIPEPEPDPIQEEFYGASLAKANIVGNAIRPIPFCSVTVTGSSVNVRYMSGASNRILGCSFNIGDSPVSLNELDVCPGLNALLPQTLSLVEYIPGVSFSFRRKGTQGNDGSPAEWEITVPLAPILDFPPITCRPIPL